jgi:cytosine/creatinine deaminase
MPDSPPQPPEGAPADTAAIVLSGARLADGRTVDVRLHRGRIETVGTAGSLAGHGTRLDLKGYLLLPAPAEPHAHGDTALTALAAEAASPSSPDDVQRRATEAALLQLGHGATALRAQVRIGDPGRDAAPGWSGGPDRGGTGNGGVYVSPSPGGHRLPLAGLEAVLHARRCLRGLCELTAVAVPGRLTGAAGADGRAVLRDALTMGTVVVGGRPDLDPDPVGHVETVLALAAEHGRPVDLHTDAADPARLVQYAAMATGLGTGVVFGPCGGLADAPPGLAAHAADRLASAGVTVVCVPQGGCADSRVRGTAPARQLRAAGVRTAAGSGALRDTANPVGRGDPLEAAFLLAAQGGLSADEAYTAVSGEARAAMGLPAVRVEAGFPAELLAVRGESLAGALSQAYSRIVIHRGRVVARTSAVREYCDTATEAALELPRQGRWG